MVLNYYRIVTFRIQYYNKYVDLSSKAGISAGFSDFTDFINISEEPAGHLIHKFHTTHDVSVLHQVL